MLTDFNIDLLKPNQSPAPQVMSFLINQNLTQLVHEPTRIQNSSATLLDIIITDSPQLFKNVTVHHNPLLSDHAMVLVELSIKKPKSNDQFLWTRSLKKIDEDEFHSDLVNLPWYSVLETDDINEMVTRLNELIIMLFEKHAPLKKIRVNQNPRPWLTDTVRCMMSLRDEALARAISTKQEPHLRYYKDLRNLVNSSIKKEKEAYFTHYVTNNQRNPKQMWNHLKKMSIANNTTLTPIPDHLRIPNEINDFFLDIPISTNLDDSLLETYRANKYTAQEFNIENCTEEQVLKIINKVDTNASGHDCITMDMIRMTLSVTLFIITTIVNKSINQQVFPEAWKLARVKPLPKSTAVDTYKDLRPISVLPALSKIIERVVCTQLTKHLESENIIPVLQSGFRSGHGTETALAKVTDDILSASDVGEGSILVLLDFSRAFDCLNHELLLAKMAYYGLSKASCSWFRSYLTDRRQYVVVEDDKGNLSESEVRTLKHGCPQGSILSPLLFIMFTADLVKNIKYTKVHLYADDTQLYCSFKPEDTNEAVRKINTDLGSIQKWSLKNSLVLNPQKSKFLILGSKHQCESISNLNPCVQINNTNIECEKIARNLGLTMDSELRFEAHVGAKIRNAFYRLKVLYGIRNHLTEKVRILLTESLVLSLFNFCDVVYGPRLFVKTERAIQRVQNACARFCFPVPKRAHITPYLNEKGILKMKARRQLHLASLVHKIVHHHKPEYLFNKFTWAKDYHRHNLRSVVADMMMVPRHKTMGFKGCFKYAATKIWNDLPPPLHKCMSTHTFKKHLRSHLFALQIKNI